MLTDVEVQEGGPRELGCGEIINWAHKGSASEALPTLKDQTSLIQEEAQNN